MDDRWGVEPDVAHETPTGSRAGTAAPGASDTLRIVLIALGVLLLVAALPLLFMGGMMGLLMGGAGGGIGFMGVLTLLVLAAGVVALVADIRHRLDRSHGRGAAGRGRGCLLGRPKEDGS